MNNHRTRSPSELNDLKRPPSTPRGKPKKPPYIAWVLPKENPKPKEKPKGGFELTRSHTGETVMSLTKRNKP